MRKAAVTCRSGALALALLAGVVHAAPAQAQPAGSPEQQTARTLGYAGVEAYQAGDYVAADESLARAFGLLRVPSLGLWSARALAKLGKLTEAAARYQEAASLEVGVGDADIQRRAQADALRERETLLPRIPTLTIEIEGADPSDVVVWLDGKVLSAGDVGTRIGVNPGNRLLVGRRGTQQTQSVVRIAEGSAASATLRFAAQAAAPPVAPAVAGSSAGAAAVKSAAVVPAALTSVAVPPSEPERELDPSSPLRTTGWVLVGVGGASLALAGVAGVVALGKRDSFERVCPDDECPRNLSGTARDDAESYNTLVTLSTVGWIAGGALAATGAVLILSQPSPEPRLALRVGPGSATLLGRF
jgi:hypothetical protein